MPSAPQPTDATGGGTFLDIRPTQGILSSEGSMPDRAEDVRFVHVAVKWDYVRADQAKECLRQQVEEGFSRRASDILVEKGYITPDQVSVITDLADEADRPRRLGEFELISKIAEGGMGAVYKAKQLSLDRIVAVKILPKKLARDGQFVERFLREARLAARFSHPNIVGAVSAGEVEGVHYLAMEYVEGQSLGQILRREKVLAEPRALELVSQIARALECAQKHGMIHRDVKPDNILMDREGTAKLADLGLARQVSDESTRLTQAGTAMGSPHYISPEQASGEADIDVRADIYSLGATFYHLVTGSTPFTGPTPAVIMTKHLNETPAPPHAVRPSVSDATSNVIMKMMARDRNARYQTPAELIADLACISRGEEPEARDVEGTLVMAASELPSRPAAPTWAVAAVAVIAAAVVAGVVLVVRAGGEGAGGKALVRAEALFEEGKLEEARRLLGALLAGNPEGKTGERVRDLFRRVDAALKEREAELKAGRAADELGAVETLLASEKSAEALARARAAAEKFPEKTDAFARLASRASELLAGKREDEAFEAAVASAEGLLARKAYAEATEAFSRLLKLRPDEGLRSRRADALFLDARARGEAAEAAGDLKGAIAIYDNALKIKPDPDLAGHVAELRGRDDCARRLAGADELEKRREFALARRELEAALELAREGEKEAISRRIGGLAAKEKVIADALAKARAHLESCELDRCVAEAGKVLALKPGQPEAKGLRDSARERMTIENSIGMTLVYMPGGEFTMGTESGDADERPPHKVVLSCFYISRTEVTNGQYELFRPGRLSERRYSRTNDCPAVKVSWEEASAFCRWLTAKEKVKHSLPTEAQWEYAATGAGKGTPYPWGGSPPGPRHCNIGWGERVNWASDGHEFAAPVGSFPGGASPQGVVDLIGNAGEWCLDWYSPDYYSTEDACGPDPVGPASGMERAIRGGSFIDTAGECRSRSRSWKNPAARAANFGFRVVRGAK